MRRLVLVGALLALLTNPSGIYFKLSRAETAEATATAPLQLNTNSPLALQTGNKPDFTIEFTLPAQQRQAQLEAAKLATEATTAAKKLAAAGFKTDFAAQYLAAAHRTGTPWQLIAAVHKIETGQSGDTAIASSAGAQGPMQFMPGTWRSYAIDGNGDGLALINSAPDAILTGANYLRAGGADKGNYVAALLNYNHSMGYVSQVLGMAHSLGL